MKPNDFNSHESHWLQSQRVLRQCGGLYERNSGEFENFCSLSTSLPALLRVNHAMKRVVSRAARNWLAC